MDEIIYRDYIANKRSFIDCSLATVLTGGMHSDFNLTPVNVSPLVVAVASCRELTFTITYFRFLWNPPVFLSAAKLWSKHAGRS